MNRPGGHDTTCTGPANLPRSVFDATPTPLALLDESEHLVDANTAFLHLLPTPVPAVTGRPWDEIVGLLNAGASRGAGPQEQTPGRGASRNADASGDAEPTRGPSLPEPYLDEAWATHASAFTKTGLANTGYGASGALVHLPSSPTSAASTSDAQREHDLASALQGILITHLPGLAGVQLAARYLTPTGSDLLGGDWYDAISLDDGGLAVVVGDVMGHDLAAAGMMGQIRNALRALIVDRGDSPADTLTRLDKALRRLGLQTLVTAALLEAAPCDSGNWALRWSNAGHPAPLLIHPDGSTELLDDGRTLMLGIEPDIPRDDAALTVAPGTTLLLYTDGLIERRTHDLEHGKSALRSCAERHAQLAPADLLDAVIADLVPSNPDDDIAVLVARFGAS